ncbi:U3 snoRNP protein, partial [Cryomyces antarcticus]
MPIIGDALVQVQEEVQISAVRLLIAIIKVPLAEIDSNAAVYVSEAVRIIKAAPSTNSELSQAALKLISAVLRERRSVTVKEGDLAYLLKRLRPDLEEPDRQGVTFNFLKAVMSRKIIITEVYEVLDTIATIMVTNQARTA